MKKKILSLVLTVCMVLSLLPALTLPASATNMVYYTVGETSIGNTGSGPIASASGDGWTWTYDTTTSAGTLTLTDAYFKGADSSSGDSYGAYLPDNTTIKLNGDSTVAGGIVSADSKGSYGIYCKGTLTIVDDTGTTGTGSLSAVGGKAGSNVSDGIMANNLVISSGKVTAVGGSGLYSGGIQCSYTLNVSETADVTALGGDATSETILGWSCGVYSNAVTLSGELTAVGGYAANGISAGIYSGISAPAGTATISGGVVTAQGGKCAPGSSCGMYAGGTFTMSGGLLSASSGTATLSSALSKAPTMTGVVSRTGSYSDKFAVYGSGTTYSSDNILTSTLDLSNNKTSSGWSNSTNSSGWKWDYAEAGSTLTLKNMVIVGTNETASNKGSFGILGGGNISIVYEGVNVVCGGTSESGDSCGIEVEETGTEGFSLSGDGTLIALGRQAGGSSCGIRFLTESRTGGFNVSGGKVIALGGDAGESTPPFSCGLEANNLTITGGDVTAVGGAAAGTGSLSAGAVAGFGISVSNGQLVAVGGHASGTGSVSVGACSYGTTIFSGDANIVAAGDGYGIGTYLSSANPANFQLGTAVADTVTVTAMGGGTAAANSDATTAISNKFISRDGGTYTTAGSAVRFRLVDPVIAVAHDGSTFTYYTSFADGWNEAVDTGNTADTTVKLLANWTATGGSFGKGIGFGDGYASSTGFILVPKEKHITLDLNGKTIDRGLTAAQTSGEVIRIDSDSATSGSTTDFTLIDSAGESASGKGDGTTGCITGGYNSGSGGGIAMVGDLICFIIKGGCISGNKTAINGGGINSTGSGIYIEMDGGKISGNVAAGNGGGLYLSGATISGFEASGGSIVGNSAVNGGGIFMNESIGIANCTIRGNTATTNGGGIYSNADGIHMGGTMVVSGNAHGASAVASTTGDAASGSGGAADNLYLRENTTVHCLTGAALTSGASIGVTTATHPASVNTVIAVTSGSSADYSRYFHSDYSDCHVFNDASTSSQIVKLGYGVIEVAHDGTTFKIYGDFSTGWNNAVGDNNQSTTKVKLLADWTATTDTTYGTSFGTGGGFVSKITKSSPSHTATLGAGVIYVPTGKSVTLDLNGKTIDRALTAKQYDGEVICIDCNSGNSTSFTLIDSFGESASGKGDGTTGCITGGFGEDFGGGVNNYGTFTMNGGTISGNKNPDYNLGGGVNNYGTFSMTGGSITDNTSGSGGGVNNYSAFSMSGGTISGNTAEGGEGGGVFNYYSTTFTMTGGTISGNTAEWGGGVCQFSGTSTMSGGSITGNTATLEGGGFLSYDGTTFTMSDGSISGNTAGVHGGGVQNGHTFNMSGGSITGNTAKNDAGGVYSTYSFTMTGGTISGNIANYDNSSDGRAGGVLSYCSTSGIMAMTMTGGEISGNYTCGNTSGGGGVYVLNSSMTVGGAAKITGNVSHAVYDAASKTASGGAADNVYLPTGITITCTASTPLTGTSPIGVTTQTAPTVRTPVAVTGSNTGDLSGHFTSDNSAYEIYDDSNTVKLRAIPTYTVTFDANGHGTAPAALTGVTSGSKITAPTEPTANGYTFGGWYKDADCTTAWDFASDTVTAATTLYAKWTANGGGYVPSTPTTGNKAEPVIVDGTEHDIGTKTTTDTTTTVTVDNSKLQEQLASASESVVVPITSKTDTTVAQLVVKNVEDMAKKDMTLSVDIGKVQYNIPSKAVQTDEVMQALGASDPSKVPVNVTITQLTSDAVTIVNGTLQVPPVQFTVTATYGGKTVETKVFTQYVNRVIELSDGTDLSKITTAVVKEPDGAERHVPTFVYTKDGKQYAKINSLTNSTYALIYNQASFADAAGKWYENIVSEMASREILMGRDTGVFDGDASITRAEFAAVLVRALGLPTSGTSKFTDVASTDWYAGAVGTASGYGLVLGYTDGSFGPNKNITRQEAMAMMQRAAKVAEFSGKTSELTAFSDANDVSDWAKSAAQYSVGSGLIVGDNGQLRPSDAITRAESATVVLRLLQKAGLVDVRSAT